MPFGERLHETLSMLDLIGPTTVTQIELESELIEIKRFPIIVLPAPICRYKKGSVGCFFWLLRA